MHLTSQLVFPTVSCCVSCCIGCIGAAQCNIVQPPSQALDYMYCELKRQSPGKDAHEMELKPVCVGVSAVLNMWMTH